MVKNNNRWMFWGFIVLAILNVILLGYIFLGSGGVSLSPSTGLSGFNGCLDSDVNTFCAVGDAQNPAALQMHTSRIRDLNNGKVEILAGAGKTIILAGLNYNGTINPTNVEVKGNLTLNGEAILGNQCNVHGKYPSNISCENFCGKRGSVSKRALAIMFYKYPQGVSDAFPITWLRNGETYSMDNYRGFVEIITNKTAVLIDVIEGCECCGGQKYKESSNLNFLI